MENADYAIKMLDFMRLSSSPRCSSGLNYNPLTYCVDSSSSRYKLGKMFFGLFFICIDVNCSVVV